MAAKEKEKTISDTINVENFQKSLLKAGKICIGIVMGSTIRGGLDKFKKPDPTKKSLEYAKDAVVFAVGMVASEIAKDETTKYIGYGVSGSAVLKTYERVTNISPLKGFEGLMDGLGEMLEDDESPYLNGGSVEEIDYEDISGTSMFPVSNIATIEELDPESEPEDNEPKALPVKGIQYNISGDNDSEDELLDQKNESYEDLTV